MIRHIVMFAFKEQAEGRTKAENIRLVSQMLEELPQKIEWIRASCVQVNAPGASDQNYDLLLISDFDSLEDLEAYRVHPDHVAVGDFMRPLRTARASVDIAI